MTKLPLDYSLIQYYQLCQNLINLLHEISEIAEDRKFTLVNSKWIDSLIPATQLVGDKQFSNQVHLKYIVEEIIRLANAPFRIAVVGEFTRGKTTLLNALLERKVLTSDRRPNTATLTTLKYGAIDRIRVEYFDQVRLSPVDLQTKNLAADLARYTSDSSMDSERYEALLCRDEQSLAEQIQEVEVWLPSEFLKQRKYELVDTPGLGSIFDTHQAITFNAIPKVDAVLFLTQFNALLGEGEVVFLSSFREYLDHFLFVLTKVDLANKESNRQEAIEKAVDFTRSVIETQLQLYNLTVYPVSAIEAVQDGLYEESGVLQLVQALDQFITCSKGKARLLNLYRAANTYSIWLEKDIQDEYDDLHYKLTQLDITISNLNSQLIKAKLFGEHLNKLLEMQIKQLTQSLLAHMSQLPIRLKFAVEVALKQLSLDALKELNITLYPIVHTIVQEWLDEQQDFFMQGVKLIQDFVQILLLELFDQDVRFSWESASVMATFILPELPSLNELVEEDKFSFAVASITGIVGFLKERLLREFTTPQPPSDLNIYEQLIFSSHEQKSVKDQVENVFSQWAQSLNEHLKFKVDQELSLYNNQVEQKIQIVTEEKKQLEIVMNIVNKHLAQIKNIGIHLETIRSEMIN